MSESACHIAAVVVHSQLFLVLLRLNPEHSCLHHPDAELPSLSLDIRLPRIFIVVQRSPVIGTIHAVDDDLLPADSYRIPPVHMPVLALHVRFPHAFQSVHLGLREHRSRSNSDTQSAEHEVFQLDISDGLD